MTETDSGARVTRLQRTTIVGSVGNLVLTTFKFVAGILGHSAAMTADAVHSLSDFMTDIVVLVFVKIADKPEDKDHDYGHGKFETLATALIGIALFAVGIGLCVNGSKAIAEVVKGGSLPRPGIIALVGAVLSVVLKEALYHYTIRVGRKYDSPAVIANAWHHRSDAFSSIASTIGIAGAIFLGEKWRVLDPIVAVVVSAFIIKVAIDLVKPCVEELLEISLPEETEQEIIRTVTGFENVSEPHHLRTRKVGRINVVDLHIRVPGEMTVSESHSITVEMEKKMRSFLGSGAIINIHVEPIRSRLNLL